MKGFFTLNRELFSHPIWQTSTPEQKVILITLIGMMNHSSSKWIWKGAEIEVKRGQRITTVAEIVKTCGKGISEKNVRTALKKFEKFNFLADQWAPEGHLITIENYNKWQSMFLETGRPTGTQLADTGQTPGTQLADIKNNNNKKNNDNKNNNIYIRPALGKFENVLITEEELEKLKERFPYDWEDRIERLSEYMSSKGKRYKSHYATILTWARKDADRKAQGTERRLDWIDEL